MVTVAVVTVTRFTDIARLRRLHPPIMFYGRRKTGKTFLVRQYYGGADYFFVKRDRSVYWENRGRSLSYSEFTGVLDALRGGLVIVDEFHRLPEEFLDYLHVVQPGNVVLVTSTLHLAKRLLSSRSPLLGLFLGYRVDLIDERDILVNLAGLYRGRDLVERAVFLREPMLLRWADVGLAELLGYMRLAVPALVGEIFLEEERMLGERYEGILRAVASGRRTVGDVTGYLYGRRLIDRQDASLVKSYMRVLLAIGLLKRYPEHGGRRYFYHVASPLIDLYFYLDEKYNFSEADLPASYVGEKLPLYVEDFVRELLAKVYGLRVEIPRSPDVDFVLSRFSRPLVAGEVKWRRSVPESELSLVEERLAATKARRRILVVPSVEALPRRPRGVEVLDAEKLVSLARESIGSLEKGGLWGGQRDEAGRPGYSEGYVD